MTNQCPFLYPLPHREQDEQHRAPLTPEPTEPAEHTLPLGQITLTLNDPDFRQGYQEGESDYEQWHSDESTVEAATLLSLVRNGWGDTSHSVMWQTGYIVGWLFHLFTHACNLGEVL